MPTQNHDFSRPTAAELPPIRKNVHGSDGHFQEKATWKNLPGNRFDPAEATPMDGLVLVAKPQPGGLVLDWA